MSILFWWHSLTDTYYTCFKGRYFRASWSQIGIPQRVPAGWHSHPLDHLRKGVASPSIPWSLDGASRVCGVSSEEPRTHPFGFLGAIAKLRKATISLFMSVRLSIRPSAWNNSASTGRIFMKFDIWGFFWKYVEKIQVSLKSDKKDMHFTLRPI